MLIEVLKSKIHRAVVTQCEPDYEGSITIDAALMEKVGIARYEKVLVADITNGARLETYAIPGEDGQMCLNGAAARIANCGDLIIIMSFCRIEIKEAAGWDPRIVVVDKENRPVRAK